MFVFHIILFEYRWAVSRCSVSLQRDVKTGPMGQNMSASICHNEALAALSENKVCVCWHVYEHVYLCITVEGPPHPSSAFCEGVEQRSNAKQPHNYVYLTWVHKLSHTNAFMPMWRAHSWHRNILFSHTFIYAHTWLTSPTYFTFRISLAQTPPFLTLPHTHTARSGGGGFESLPSPSRPDPPFHMSVSSRQTAPSPPSPSLSFWATGSNMAPNAPKTYKIKSSSQAVSFITVI